eukprot:2964018-Rhodomonas_salina.1
MAEAGALAQQRLLISAPHSVSRFWLHTTESRYLTQAICIALRLFQQPSATHRGWRWEAGGRRRCVGAGTGLGNGVDSVRRKPPARCGVTLCWIIGCRHDDALRLDQLLTASASGRGAMCSPNSGRQRTQAQPEAHSGWPGQPQWQPQAEGLNPSLCMLFFRSH